MAGFIIVLAIVAFSTITTGQEDDIEILKTDYMFRAKSNSGHRLAGWSVISPKMNNCDMVRRNITTYGYCFQDKNEARGIDTKKERGWVREVVQQWEKCGGIKIAEEKQCRTGPDFITIIVDDYHPMVMPSYERDTCKIFGFTMYTSFYTSDEIGTGYRRTEKVNKAVIQMYMLHEFGHFLGFDHEHNRNDMVGDKCSKDESLVGPNAVYANYYISKQYDLDSIMNYCRPNSHYKPWLSDKDKESAMITWGNKGNKAQCDAVTKHWKWSKGEGLDDTRVREIEIEETMGFNACADLIDDCVSRRDSCGDKVMKEYYCPKTCGNCK